MATDNKSSILVDELLPEFLDTEGPKFKAFMRAYYEWLETTNQITDRSKNLLKYGDIDTTDDEFIKYFQREVLSDFPENVLADKALLISRIKDLYRSKGSEQAYKMLFRILYDDEVEFYYPQNDILRVSDGRWTQEKSLRLSPPFTGNLFNIGGRNVKGLTSGATAKVDRVVKTLEEGVEVFEIFLINIRGTFQDTETVQTTEGDLSGVILSSIGPLENVIMDFGGSGHRVGDRVKYISASGVGANGAVLSVDGSSIVPVIINGGSGYTLDSTVTLTGGDGTGAAFSIDSLSSTETIQIYQDTVSDLENTRIDANTYITSNSGAISANLSIANSSTVLSAALGTANLTVGTIASMSATSRGSGYTTVPTVSIRQDDVADQNLPDGSGGIKGFNAVVVANNAGGSITSASVDNSGTGYSRIDPLTVTNVTRSAQNGTAAPEVTGIVDYNGKYTDTKGFISWNNKLQDNYYYQQFAYVLRSKQSTNTYREIVKKLLHPAGTNVFGDLLIQSNAAIAFSSNTYIYYSIEFAVADSVESTLDFGTTSVQYVIGDVESITSTEAHENDAMLIHNITHTFTPSTIVSTDAQIDMTLGGAELIPVESALTFGTAQVTPTISPTSIEYDPDGTYAIAPINAFTGNTISQLQSITFNTYYPNPQVGIPILDIIPVLSSAEGEGYLQVLSTLSIPGPVIETFVGGANLNTIPSTLGIGTPEVLFFIDYPTLAYNETRTLADAFVVSYEANTVTQLQSSTFNSEHIETQVGAPTVEHS